MINENQNSPQQPSRRTSPLLSIATFVGVVLGAIVFICGVVLLLFPSLFANRFVKPELMTALDGAFPEYSVYMGDMHYSLFTNQLTCDSVSVMAVDGSFSGRLGPITLTGIGWRHLLGGGTPDPRVFSEARIEAEDIKIFLQKKNYTVQCDWLTISVPDSDMVAESIEVRPQGGDEQFFRGDAFRVTRFRISIPEVRVKGVAVRDLAEGKAYRARSATIQDALLDVMVNKDKPNTVHSSRPIMPGEMLASMQESLRVDSLIVLNGRMVYKERFAVGEKPARITFDNIQMQIAGISNDGDSSVPVVVHAQWNLANAGVMKLLMFFPVASPDWTFQYSGSLAAMELSALNPFLEVSDLMRVKEGSLQGVTFDIDIEGGVARGNVTGTYTNLTLAAISKVSGSEDGFSDGLKSFMANNFKIRRNNEANKKKPMKIGEVKYTRELDDPFIRTVWFSLRTGVRDVVGF